jgi:4-hydroxybenzoate polyprenyltransferase
MSTSVIDSPAPAPTSRYLACLRLSEILVLQGSPLLGVAFGISRFRVEQMAPLVILIVANICLVAHIFMLNDWAGLSADLSDPNKAARVFTTRGIDARQVAGVTIILLVVSLVLFSRLGARTLGLAFAIAALSALYSLPALDWKGRPGFSSIVHLVGGVLHFLLGYSVVSAIDGRAVATATFFGLTFAAGHLTQELRDYRGDVLNAIKTNAVTFGQQRTFVASIALFTLAYAVLLVLTLEGVLPRGLAVLAGLYPLHLRWSLEALREGLTYPSITRLQIRYRLLYATIGIAMVTALLR